MEEVQRLWLWVMGSGEFRVLKSFDTYHTDLFISFPEATPKLIGSVA